MRKGLGKPCLVGAISGVAANYLIAIAVSYVLRLGYFMPTLASLPERVGGEMNAVLLQLALCALAGAGVGAGWHILRRRGGHIVPKLLLSCAALIGFLMPAVVLAACMLK